MATAAGRRLTLAHKKAQGQIGTETVGRMRTVWDRLSGDDLDGSFQRWHSAAVPIIGAQRLKSAQTAASYLSTFRVLEVGTTTDVVLATAIPDAEVSTSLLVTGPLSVKRAMSRGIPLARAMAVAEAASAASAMRHAMNGGRQTITDTLAADPASAGYERVASGNACAFCQLLAGRGAVYSAESADFESHDGCGCTAEPVYR